MPEKSSAAAEPSPPSALPVREGLMVSYVNPVPFRLSILGLAVQQGQPAPTRAIDLGQPCSLGLELAFSRPGALALVALEIPIVVTYYAESVGLAPCLTLGQVCFSMQAGELSYGNSLTQIQVCAHRFEPGLYKLKAVVRVGKPEIQPSLISGLIEGVVVEAYT